MGKRKFWIEKLLLSTGHVLSHSAMSNSLGSLCPWDSPGQNTGVDCHAFLQGIFLTQVSHTAGRFFTAWATRGAQEYWSEQPIPFPGDLPDPGLPHCRQILYRLSHQGSPRILEWTARPFSRGSSWPGNRLLHCRWILYQLSYEGLSTGYGANVCFCQTILQKTLSCRHWMLKRHNPKGQ